MSAAVDAVIFDLGNVLLTLDWERAARRLGARTRRSELELIGYAQQAAAVRELSVGAISVQEFCDEVMGALGFKGDPAEFAEIWSDMFQPNEPMLELLRALKPRCPRILLSNTNVVHMRSIFRRFPAIWDLDGHVLSHEVGVEKPAPQIYQFALRRYRLTAARTVFVDDLIENVRGARAVGLRAIHYQTAAQTKAELAQLGLRVD